MSPDHLEKLNNEERKTRPSIRDSIVTCHRSLIRTICGFLLFLLPSFISAYFGPAEDSSKQAHVRPTAFLDGLRGVAAWSVVNAHISALIGRSGGAGWGHDGGHHELWKLPFINLVYKGDTAVALFFVISGYVLSVTPINAMSKSPRDPVAAYRKMSSAVFRRPFRLLAPSFASTFLVLILVRLGYFDYFKARVPEFDTVYQGWDPILKTWPVRTSTIWEQLVDLIRSDVGFFTIFMPRSDPGYNFIYNSVLWTIKLELRGSLILFLTHAALFYVAKSHRVAIISALIVSGLCVNSFDFPRFWVGYLIAELCQNSSGDKGKRSILLSMVWWCVLLVGGFLCSCSSWESEKTPTYAWLLPFTPFGYWSGADFWIGAGSTLVVLSVAKLPLMKAFYKSPVIHYLGQISFSLYLVHFWIVHGIGALIFFYTWSHTGTDTLLAIVVGFCVSYCILLSITIWVADLFWRCVDIPSVKIASKVEKWLFSAA